ncbi:MAG TPA: hypothetical protein VGD54_07975, partial [Steroidobacteraceae bacterium]
MLRSDGSVIWNTAPKGSRGDAQIRPPWAAMIDREIAKPIPIPSDFVVNIDSKMRSPAPGSKPFPESSTVMRTPVFGPCALHWMINSRRR